MQSQNQQKTASETIITSDKDLQIMHLYQLKYNLMKKSLPIMFMLLKSLLDG